MTSVFFWDVQKWSKTRSLSDNQLYSRYRTSSGSLKTNFFQATIALILKEKIYNSVSRLFNQLLKLIWESAISFLLGPSKMAKKNMLHVGQYIFLALCIIRHWFLKKYAYFSLRPEFLVPTKIMVNYQTSQYEPLNNFCYLSCLGIFKYVRNILQFTVSLDYPVKTCIQNICYFFVTTKIPRTAFKKPLRSWNPEIWYSCLCSQQAEHSYRLIYAF